MFKTATSLIIKLHHVDSVAARGLFELVSVRKAIELEGDGGDLFSREGSIREDCGVLGCICGKEGEGSA